MRSTSVAAYNTVRAAAPNLREKVYNAIVAAGSRGATRAEIVAATGIKENTVNARVRELVLAYRIEETQYDTRDGRSILYVNLF